MSDRPPVLRCDSGRELYAGKPLPHFNEVDECAGLDALVTNRVWSAMQLDPATTLHDVRWGEHYSGGDIDEFVWVFQISGAVPASHIAGGYAKASSERQPPMYFRLGGGTLKGVCKPGHVVWSRVFVEDGALHVDMGRATAIELPAEETERRLKSVTPQWPIMHTLLHGVTRDQFMARHRANHLNVAYAPTSQVADQAMAAKAAMMAELGIQRSSLWRLDVDEQERITADAGAAVNRVNGSTSTSQPLYPKGLAVPFFLVTALFFLWGVPTNLNDVLIRQFMKSFAITRFEAGLVQSAFLHGLFSAGDSRGAVDAQNGLQVGIVIGLLLFASGTLSFLAGRAGGSLWLLPLCAVRDRQRAFVSGDGLESLHRPIGRTGERGTPVEFFPGIQSAGRDQWRAGRHGFYLLGRRADAAANCRDAGGQHLRRATCKHETMRVVIPYLVVGAVALLWAFLIARTKFPDDRP